MNYFLRTSGYFLLGVIVLSYWATPSFIALIESAVMLSEHQLAQAWLVLPLVFAGLLCAMVALQATSAGIRRKILASTLLTVVVLSLILLIGDSQDFTKEEGSITYFTSVMLVFAGASGALNLVMHRYVLGSPFIVQAFWGAITAAFFFAGLDEAFALHEKIGGLIHEFVGTGGSAGFFRDAVTAFYSLSGVVVAFLAYRFLRPYIARPGQQFHIFFFAAAGVYFVSTLLDTFDTKLVPLSTELHFVYMAALIEEILEFTAASLFFLSFVIALMECNEQWLLRKAISVFSGQTTTGRFLKAGVYFVTAVFVIFALFLPILVPADFDLVLDNDRVQVETVADRTNGLSSPDGIFVANNRLYISNDDAANVSVLVEGSNVQVIAGSEDGLDTPESVAVAPDGSIVVVDDGLNSVMRFEQGTWTQVLTPAEGLRAPKGLVITSDGRLFVSDTQTDTIYKYDSGTVEIYASAIDGLHKPGELAIDSRGNLYVIVEETNSILKIAPDGTVSTFLSGFANPEGLAVGEDNIFVTDSSEGTIFRFDMEGHGGRWVRLHQRFRNLEDIVVDEDGSVYVSIRRRHPVSSKIFKITEAAQ